jgi:hypothetical protein
VQYILAKINSRKRKIASLHTYSKPLLNPLSIEASSSLPPLAATFSQICPEQQGN